MNSRFWIKLRNVKTSLLINCIINSFPDKHSTGYSDAFLLNGLLAMVCLNSARTRQRNSIIGHQHSQNFQTEFIVAKDAIASFSGPHNGAEMNA